MFSIGTSEPIAAAEHAIVRHSIVWLGDPAGETARGLPASHPLCLVLLRILEQVSFAGTWLTCREVSPMREFERKALLLRLRNAKWALDPDQSEVIRAHRAVRVDSPWPFGAEPALPWPQHEILVVGCLADYLAIDCHNEHDWRSQQAIRGDGVVLNSELATSLAAQRGYAISVGRTQTENSPGLSILGPEGWLDPELLVAGREVVGVHRGADAGRAWSYGRVSRSP
jgi:hypothetical protein